MANGFLDVITRGLNWFQRPGRERAKVPLMGDQRTSIWPAHSQEVYPEINTRTAISEGFNGNVAVYSIVMYDAEKFASIPRYVYDKREMEEKAAYRYHVKAIKKSPKLEGKLTDLLNRPNPHQSQDMFLTLVRAYYKICGNAYIWLNRGDTSVNGEEVDDMVHSRKEVLEMYVLPADKIIVVPEEGNPWGVYGYILESGTRVPLRKADVIHWKAPNLGFDTLTRNQAVGMSPLEPGKKSLEENNSLTNAIVRRAQNDGSKAVIYNKDLARMTSEQESSLRRVIDKKLNGNDVAGAVATMQGEWGLLNLASSIDLKLQEGKELSWKELCYLFGVPYQSFDSQVTYQNAEWSQKNWVNNKIVPAAKQLDGELNRMLLKAFNLETTAFIACDPSELPEMKQDMSQLATAFNTSWWLTPDEAREAMGYEPLGGKYGEVWAPSGRVSETDKQDDIDRQADEMMEINRLNNDAGAD